MPWRSLPDFYYRFSPSITGMSFKNKIKAIIMNRKFILLLSLLIVAVGIVGILINTDNGQKIPRTQPN